MAWLREYGFDLERWSEFYCLTQAAIEVVRNEGYCSTVVEWLDTPTKIPTMRSISGVLVNPSSLSTFAA